MLVNLLNRGRWGAASHFGNIPLIALHSSAGCLGLVGKGGRGKHPSF